MKQRHSVIYFSVYVNHNLFIILSGLVSVNKKHCFVVMDFNLLMFINVDKMC